MAKKRGKPHNEKRYTLKPLTTRQALKKALQAGRGKPQDKPKKEGQT